MSHEELKKHLEAIPTSDVPNHVRKNMRPGTPYIHEEITKRINLMKEPERGPEMEELIERSDATRPFVGNEIKLTQMRPNSYIAIRIANNIKPEEAKELLTFLDACKLIIPNAAD